MKYKHVRKANHYCCRGCDGPYSTYKKLSSKRAKMEERVLVKKEIKKALNEPIEDQ